MMYAIGVNKTIANGEDYRDGKVVIRNMENALMTSNVSRRTYNPFLL